MKTSSLFRKIEELQGSQPWGHVLDAGSGTRSLSWIASLPTERWTAVTAQSDFADDSRRLLGEAVRKDDRIIVGNWADSALPAGEQFDTVILDYLVGAVDAFAPYFQEALLQRMAAHVRGALYLIGLEPYVPIVASDEVGRFVGDLGRLRDACMLLARDRPYREFPSRWVVSQLQRAGFEVTYSKYFSIRYRRRFLNSQLEICEDRVRRFEDAALAGAMRDRIAAMRARGEALIERHDGLLHGRDHLICAVPAV